MKFKEWWENLLSKFGGKEEPDDGQVMELAAAEAPEPVPDRKTSDETIVEMADSTLENGVSRTAGPVPETEEVPMADPAPGSGEEETEDPAPVFEEDPAAAPVPEFDEWTEETSAEYEGETDGIREK